MIRSRKTKNLNKTTALALLCVLLANCCLIPQCSAQSDPLPQIPPKVADVAGSFSISEKLSLIELDVLGKSDPKKEAGFRLDLLESNIFGKEYQSQSKNLTDRLRDILVSLRPSNELIVHLVQEKIDVPEWASKRAKTPWLSTSYQDVALLETELTGKINPKELLIDRIRALQKLVWPDKTYPTQASITDQIEILLEALQPAQASVDGAKQRLARTGMLGSSSSNGSVLGSIGSGVKKAGKKVGKYTQPARGVLQSPTFWLALIGAGAVVGLAFAMRNSGSSNQNSQFVSYPNRGCCGSLNCKYCTNCHDCVWCNHGGSPCNKYYAPDN